MAKKEKKLEEMTVKELRAEVVARGMSEKDAEDFTTKKPLINTINTLIGKENVATLEDRETKVEKKRSDQRWLSKAERMRDKLSKQPKIRFFVPLAHPEKIGKVKKVKIKGRMETVHVSGAIETVTLNGYKTIIPKGRFVEIPEQVAEVLAKSYQMTADAGKDMLADRIDEETGKPVSDRL